MELLNESESRAFSSFLDSFASTAASPAAEGFSPPPSLPSLPPTQYPHYSNQDHGGGTSSTWTRPNQDGQWNQGNRMTTSSGASNSNGLTDWNASPYHQAPRQPSNGFAPPKSNPYYQESQYVPLPPPSQISSHPPQISQQQQDTEAAKLRKLQHAEELEKWMAQSRPLQQQETRQTLDDSPSPPKRTRSSEEYPGRREGRDRGSGFMQGDPIALMLEAERKAGYAYGRSLNAASIVAAHGSKEGSASIPHFSPSPPPPPPRTSAPRTRRDSDSDFEPPPPAPTLSTSRSTRRRPATSITMDNDEEGSGSMAAPPPPKSSKRKVAPTSRTSNSKPKPPPRATRPLFSTSTSPSPLDPESTDSALASIPPIPLSTPSNVPRIKPRPRPVRRRKRSSSTSSISDSPAPSIGASTSNTGSGKPALLSAEQKKANHIASEQKRRKAIREGYDGLCRVVPVLKEAVEEFEERVRKLESEKSSLNGNGNGRGGKKRKGKELGGGSGNGGGKTGALMGGINVGGEKIDGRAGPKSEAVVLSKTVDHVRQLLLNRATLLERLSNAYSLAQERGIQVSPATANEWDEPWDGGSDIEEDENRVKTEEGGVRGQGEGEDEEMWEDEQ